MVKDTQFSFRIDPVLLSGIRKICEKYHITISGFIVMGLQNLLSKNKYADFLDKDLKVHLEKEKRKELCRRSYIMKNMFTRVMDLSLSSQLISGSINMKSINKVIDTYVREFENYDDEMKKDIKTDFKIMIKQLRNQKFLLSNDKNVRMIKYAKTK